MKRNSQGGTADDSNSNSSGADQIVPPPPSKRSKSSFTVRLAQDTANGYGQKKKTERTVSLFHSESNCCGRASTAEQGVNILVSAFQPEYAFLSELTADNSSPISNASASRLGINDVSLSSSSTTTYSAGGGSSTRPSFEWLTKPKKVAPPLQNVRGVLPEIGYYWAQDGAVLRLAKCNTTDQEQEHQQQQTIVETTMTSDAPITLLVCGKPRTGVFKAEYKWMLIAVAGDTVHILVYSPARQRLEDSGLAASLPSSSSSQPLTSHNSQQQASVNAGHSSFTAAVCSGGDVVGSGGGRVFLGTTDGYVYELLYRRRPTALARLRRVTGSVLTVLAKRVLPIPSDPVAQLVADGQRGLVYCLRGRSSDIEAYEVHRGGFTLVAAARGLYRKVCERVGEYFFHRSIVPRPEVLRRFGSFNPSAPREFWNACCDKYFARFIVSIHCVALDTVSLVAVTSQGVLLSFAQSQRLPSLSLLSSSPSSTLDLINIDLRGCADGFVSVSTAAAAPKGSAFLTAFTRVPEDDPYTTIGAGTLTSTTTTTTISCASSVVPGSTFFSTLSLVSQPPDAPSPVRAIIPLSSRPFSALSLPLPPPPPPPAATVAAASGTLTRGAGAAPLAVRGKTWVDKCLGALWSMWSVVKGTGNTRGTAALPDETSTEMEQDGRANGDPLKAFYTGLGAEMRTLRYAQYAGCDTVEQLFEGPQMFLVECGGYDNSSNMANNKGNGRESDDSDGDDSPQFYALTKQRPLEVFRGLVLDVLGSRYTSPAEASSRLQVFLGAFAPEEVFVMCIALYCSATTTTSSSYTTITSAIARSTTFNTSEGDDESEDNKRVAEYAQKAFLGKMRLGYRSNNSGRKDENAFKEHRLGGVCAFLSRVLQPLLASALCSPGDPRVLAWKQQDAVRTLVYLRRAHELLTQAQDTLYPADKYNDLIPQLLCVLDRTCDALALVNILAGSPTAAVGRQKQADGTETHNTVFTYVVGLLDRTLQLELPAAQLYDIVHANPGENTLLLTLVAAAVDVFERVGRKDAFRALLARECPSFFPCGEFARFRGVQLLVQARACRDPTQEKALLRDSLAEFLKVPMLGIDAICHAYAAAGFYEGVVKLALQAAEDIDRSMDEGAILFFTQQQQQHQQRHQHQQQFQAGTAATATAAAAATTVTPYDRQRCVAAYKEKCYQYVLRLFGALRAGVAPAGLHMKELGVSDPTAVDPAEVRRLVALALSYKSRQWHMRLYEWYVANNLISELLDIDSQHLLGFLQGCDDRLNLVWRYYARHDRPEEAARAIYTNATSRTSRISIEKRIELLAAAAGLLKTQSNTAVSIATTAAALERHVHSAMNTLVFQRHIHTELVKRSIPEAKALEDEPHAMNDLFINFVVKHGLYALVVEGMRLGNVCNPNAILKAYGALIDSCRSSSQALATELASLARQVFGNSNSAQSNTFFPTEFIVRKLMEEPGINVRLVLHNLIEAGVPHMLLFTTLRSAYGEDLSVRNFGYNYIGSDDGSDGSSSSSRELLALKDAAFFVVEEMIRALEDGSDIRCTGADVQQIRDFIHRNADAEKAEQLLRHLAKIRSQIVFSFSTHTSFN